MEKRTKILFIMTALNGGGAENVLTTLLRNLDYTKYDVELLLTFLDGVYLDKLPKEVKLKSIYGTHKLLRRVLMYLYRHFGWLTMIYYLVRRQCEHYDTIVSFMEGEPLLYHSMLLGNASKNVTWVHIDLVYNHWSKKYFYNDAENNIYNQMDMIVHVSHMVKERFNQVITINNDIAQIVLYNIIESDYIRNLSLLEAPISKSKLTICASGRLESQKAFHRLINVSLILKNKDYDFDVWIVGEGTLREKLQEQINNNGLQDIVHLLGFHKNPYPIIKQADIYVSTSITEGLPIVICEALVLGLPIVATRVTGTTELLDDEYGVLVEECENSIAEAISHLIEDTDLRTKYQKKSLERADIFELSKSLKQIYNCIGE